MRNWRTENPDLQKPSIARKFQIPNSKFLIDKEGARHAQENTYPAMSGLPGAQAEK